MLATLSTLAFATMAAALPAGETVAVNAAPRIPIYYEYGGYPRIQANISWGSPAQKPIPAIFDTGSMAFWTYGPNAIINDGSRYLGIQGPCNKTVQQNFNWPKSSSHSPVKNLTFALAYSYGGNGKIISAYQLINDTMSFDSKTAASIKNVQVAIANFTLVRQADDGCKIDVNSFDQSILGVGTLGAGDNGPSFRSNLRAQGQVSSDILSMWMGKAPSSIKGTYRGTAQFGRGLPKSAYSGDLVAIKRSSPDDGYVGYYSALPTLTVGGKKVSSVDSSVKYCLIDSGTGQDQLPFNLTEISQSSKVYQYTSPEGFLLTAYKGSCDSIKQDEVFEFTFPGATKGENAVVKVPIRSYARGTSDGLKDIPKDVCPLTLELENYGSCVFGAPFFTAAALQFDDDKNTISLAQGGVN